MTHFNARKWLLDRRHVLRGVGASMALPLLDCMLPARPMEVAGRPKRSVFIYIPNGVNTLDWQIQSAGPDYELTEPLQPLEKHRGNFTPFSGLHHPHAIGQNHKCDKIWLTGARIGQGGVDFRNTVSADQLMAEVTGVHTRFPSLELTITGGTLAWSRDGVPLPAERKPSATFERLFGVAPGGIEAARRRLRRRASVLDVVFDDAKRFRRTIGDEDRSKLDEYLGAIRDVELRTERADAWLDIEKPEVDPDLRTHLSRNIPDADAGDYYRTVYDLMLLALRTDMVRVITCMSGSENFGLAIPEIGVQQTRHELSHHNGNPEQMRRLTQTDTFLIEQLAYFLDQLQSVDEQGESLLDRTMVLFGSGMAYGHSHGNANLPLILAGGEALGLRHGRHLDYNLPKIGAYDMEDHYPICLRPVDEQARLSNLLLTLLQRMDVEARSFGDSIGPIPELVA
jgi:hypothetical protein